MLSYLSAEYDTLEKKTPKFLTYQPPVTIITVLASIHDRAFVIIARKNNLEIIWRMVRHSELEIDFWDGLT